MASQDPSRDFNLDVVSEFTVKSGNSNFDLRGSYTIRCPDIESDWDGEDLTLDVYLETCNEKLHLFGIFEFRAIIGIMRSENAAPLLKKDKTGELSGNGKLMKMEISVW